jgi:hypothetical protein
MKGRVIKKLKDGFLGIDERGEDLVKNVRMGLQSNC